MGKKRFGRFNRGQQEQSAGEDDSSNGSGNPDMDGQTESMDETEINAEEMINVEGDKENEGISSTDPVQLELEELRREAKENYDKYLRAIAETDNVKKRALKEKSDILRYAGEGLARDLVEVLDNLDRALDQNVSGANEELLKGVAMVRDQFVAVFERHSISRESALGKQFDPNKHEALTTVPTADHPPGTVIEEFKKTYFYKDKVLRVGQVVVAAAVSAEAGSSGE